MQLNFTKDNNGWSCEFQATNDFNLHIERSKEGNLNIYQKGESDQEYAFTANYDVAVIDIDCVAVIYPKLIKIASETEILVAEVTFAE